MRLVGQAPFRCHDCGLRFDAPTAQWPHDHHRKHKSVLGYLGIPRTERRRWKLVFLTIVAAAILIVITIYLVSFLSEPSRPPQPLVTP